MRRITAKIVWMVLPILLVIPVQAQVQLSLSVQDNSTSYAVGDTVRFELKSDSSFTDLDALAMTMRLTYDDYYMVPINVESTGTILSTAGWSVTANTTNPDEIIIAAAGTTALADTGSVLFIDFELVRQGTGWLSFDPANTYFNESVDEIPLTFVNTNVGIAPIPTISVFIPSGNRIIGESFQAQVSNAVAPIVWSVTDTTRAKVDSLGIVTGKNIGTFGVIAEDSRGIIDTTNTEFLGFRLTAADTSNFQNQQVGISIQSTDLSGLEVFSGELFLRFDTSMVSLLSISPGDLMENSASINYGMSQNGMSIVFAQTSAMNGAGSLLELEFQYDNRPFTNYFTIESIEFNESLTGVGSTFITQSLALPNLSLSNNSLPEYLVGDSLQFSVSNNNGPVNWAVSNSNLATIDENGKLFSIKGGSIRVSVEDSIGARAESGEFTFYDVKLTLPDTSMVLSDTLLYPIRIQNVENSSESVLSTDFEITYTNTNLNYLGYETTGSLTQGWSVVENQLSDNKVKIVGGGANEILTDGDLLFLKFKIDTSVTTDQYAYLNFADHLLNEGSPNALIDNGQIFISSKPLAPTLLSPANNEQNVLLNAVLDWTEGIGATSYDVQVSTSSSFFTNIVDTSLVLTDSLLVNNLTGSTTYFWRVRSVNDSGVSVWTNAYNFRTQDPVPLAPTLINPTADITNLELTPTFSWNSVDFALNYRLQISSQIDFSNTVIDSLLGPVTTLNSDSLDFDQTYFWRVFASNLTGEGEASETRMFTTIIEKPEIPSLLFPVDSLDRAETTAFLSWNAADRADSYIMQLTTVEDFSTINYEKVVFDTVTNQAGLSYLTDYYWRVKATNTGGESDYSEERTFQTKAIPAEVPVLELPVDVSIDTDTLVTLSWLNANGAISYDYQLGTDDNFAGIVQEGNVGTDTSLAVIGLEYLTSYYWRVRTVGAQDTSDYSEPYSFTTKIALPATPMLVSPADGVTEQPLSLDLVWNTAERASEYKVEISASSDFSSFVLDQTVTDTTVLTTGLANLTDYFWRVKSINSTGESDYSISRTFQTKAVDATVPLLISPVSGTSATDTSVTILWSSATGALEYEYQLSNFNTFSSLVATGVGADTTALVSGLDYLTQYFWRARAIGAQDTSDWSGVFDFTTKIALPEAPSLLSPADATTQVPVNTTLLWNSAERAAGYSVQLSKVSTFDTVIIDSAITDTTLNLTGLDYLTDYFWRLKSTNSTGDSDYSSSRSFQTKAQDASVPTLLSPADFSVGVDTTANFVWSSSEGSLNYQFQLSTSSDFSTTINEVTGPDTTTGVSGLDFVSDYFWRVRGVGAQDTSVWSTPFSFTTRPDQLAAPILKSPGKRSLDLPDSVTFVWTSVPEADGYMFELDDDTSTVDLVSSITLSDTTTTIENLAFSTNFLWRVKSSDSNTSRESVWTPWFDFTTQQAPNLPPQVIDSLGTIILDEDFAEFEVAKLDTIFDDPDGLPMVFELVSAPDFVTSSLDENGVLTLQSVQDTSGVGELVVRATDDLGQTASDTLTIIVEAVNDLPFVIQLPDTIAFKQGDLFEFFIDTAFADVEDEVSELTYTTSVNPTDVFAVFDPIAFKISLTSPVYIGFADLTITVTDSDGGELQATIVLDVMPITSNEFDEGIPLQFSLDQNYPNPFNPSSTINFGIPEASDVRIDVYNMLGQHVGTLVDQKMQAGYHSVIFEASSLSSGTYIYRIVAGDFVQTKKMMLIK